jgi:hypothetical protein
MTKTANRVTWTPEEWTFMINQTFLNKLSNNFRTVRQAIEAANETLPKGRQRFINPDTASRLNRESKDITDAAKAQSEAKKALEASYKAVGIHTNNASFYRNSNNVCGRKSGKSRKVFWTYDEKQAMMEVGVELLRETPHIESKPLLSKSLEALPTSRRRQVTLSLAREFREDVVRLMQSNRAPILKKDEVDFSNLDRDKISEILSRIPEDSLFVHCHKLVLKNLTPTEILEEVPLGEVAKKMDLPTLLSAIGFKLGEILAGTGLGGLVEPAPPKSESTADPTGPTASAPVVYTERLPRIAILGCAPQHTPVLRSRLETAKVTVIPNFNRSQIVPGQMDLVFLWERFVGKAAQDRIKESVDSSRLVLIPSNCSTTDAAVRLVHQALSNLPTRV